MKVPNKKSDPTHTVTMVTCLDRHVMVSMVLYWLVTVTMVTCLDRHVMVSMVLYWFTWRRKYSMLSPGEPVISARPWGSEDITNYYYVMSCQDKIFNYGGTVSQH